MENRVVQSLPQLRRAYGLTQQQLADQCNAIAPDVLINKRLISLWERGERIPSSLQLSTLAAALFCTSDRICHELPPEAVRDAEAITEAISRTSDSARAILHWMCTACPIPLEIIIQYIGMHITMLDTYRADTAGMTLHKYVQAVADGALVPGSPPVNAAVVNAAWQRIAGSTGSWI